MKQIPNLFTLFNLLFGCIAIVFIMQTGQTIAYLDREGFTQVDLPEKITWGALFIFAAAVIDFLDGFLARLFKATSEMGKQLDSLADLVSFGVAPGLIIYQFLRLSYSSQPDGVEVSMIYLLPAFLIPCAAAYRLARFNLDTSQQYGFKGLPAPAAGLLIASFPLLYWYSYNATVVNLMQNKWFWYAVIVLISLLMVSRLP